MEGRKGAGRDEKKQSKDVAGHFAGRDAAPLCTALCAAAALSPPPRELHTPLVNRLEGMVKGGCGLLGARADENVFFFAEAHFFRYRRRRD